MQSIHALKQLYELDDSQWLGETISLLRNHQFQQLDLEHLIEELEDLGKELPYSIKARDDDQSPQLFRGNP